MSPETVPGTAGPPLFFSEGIRAAFLNLRVADIHALYSEWTARGAEFLTPPIQLETEIRCYIRDPDGHLIEVGQTTRTPRLT